jgi:AraC-like DNA-binding protein
MINIIHYPVNSGLESVVSKISIFYSDGLISFRQKLTPTPFSCLTYNHSYIPEFEVKRNQLPVKGKLQITGPKTRDDLFALHAGILKQVLLEFTPCGFFRLFCKSPAGYVNRVSHLSEFVPYEDTVRLEKRLSRENDQKSHLLILQDFISGILTITKYKKVDYIEKAIVLIESLKGRITVNDLCREINISERQLNRKFTEITGIKPARFIKIRQLHYIIHLLQAQQFLSLKQLAYETGFYDPAHFNNSFKKHTGMSPGEFLTSDAHVAFKYYDAAH